MTVYETTNQNTIYHWVSSRGLWPACVVGSPDRIRIGGDDSANPGEDLEPIEWWRWFKEFENRQLMLIYDPSKGWYTLGSRKAPTGRQLAKSGFADIRHRRTTSPPKSPT